MIFNKDNLKQLKKTELYRIAKKYDQTIPYSKTTKTAFISLILDHIKDNNDVSLNGFLPETDRNYQNSGRILEVCENFNPEYIENLKEQVNYWKDKCNDWQEKYINIIMVEKIQNQPIKNRIKISSIHKEIKKIKTETIRILPEKIQKKPEIKKTKWSNLDKTEDIKLPKSQKIKENSLKQYINSTSKIEIEKMGFNSRSEYYENQLKIMNSRKNIMHSIITKKLKKYIN